MTNSKRLIASLVAAAAMIPASASFASSLISLSDSVSGTVTSLSDSVQRISNSSSKAVGMAEGDYKVTDIAAVDGHPEKMRLTLIAAGNDRDKDLYLYVPRDDFNRTHIARGQTVTATQRPYGVAFAEANTPQPFVVVLNDTWVKDLRTNVVSI